MDIQLLSKMIGELLLDHDSIGLAGLGTFVAEVVPASFSDRGYTINPPYRRLSFHSGHPSDDTLFRYYAASNNMDVAEARAILSDYIGQIKAVLQERRIVVFPELGRLRMTRNDTVFFVADENLDIYPDGLALESVSLKTHVEAPEELSYAVSSLRKIVESPIEPEPVAEPESVAEPEPAVSEPVPAVEPEPEPAVSEPEPVQEAPVAEPVVPAPAPRAVEEEAPRRHSRWWIAPVAVLGLAVLALAAFLILAHVAPDFIDSILYSPEELRIINYPL